MRCQHDVPGPDRAVLVETDEPCKWCRSGLPAHIDENPVNRKLRPSPGSIQESRFHAGRAPDLEKPGVPEHFHRSGREEAVRQGGLGPQRIAPVDEGDPGSEGCQVKGLLDSAVASSHDHDMPSPEEGLIACGAVADTPAVESLFPGDAQPGWCGACGDYESTRVHRATVGLDQQSAAIPGGGGRDLFREEDSAGGEGLGAHDTHQGLAGGRTCAGIVLDPVCEDGLSAGLPALEDDVPQPVSGQIECCREACRAAARHHHVETALAGRRCRRDETRFQVELHGPNGLPPRWTGAVREARACRGSPRACRSPGRP